MLNHCACEPAATVGGAVVVVAAAVEPRVSGSCTLPLYRLARMRKY